MSTRSGQVYIVDALCGAAERLRGGVYILTALGKHLRPEVLELDEELDGAALLAQQRAERHEEHLRRLAHAGAWLRSAEDCHAKFCVVDDLRCLVTSANATWEAYELNPEHALELAAPSVAGSLGRLFAHVWQHHATVESIPGSRLDIRTLQGEPSPRWRPLPDGGDVALVATLGRVEQSLFHAALATIDEAREQLTIATYSLIGVENHPIGAALLRALARGVRVDLLLQPRNHLAAQRATCAWLLARGGEAVRMYGHRRTHAKALIADRRACLLWTGNLEATHGWDRGIEVGTRIRDAGTACAVAEYVAGVAARATYSALTDPTVEQLVARRVPAQLTGDWHLHLPADSAFDGALAALERGPIDLVKRRDAAYLRCGDQFALEIEVVRDAGVLRATRALAGAACPSGRGDGWVTGTLHVERVASPSRSSAGVHRRKSRRRA